MAPQKKESDDGRDGSEDPKLHKGDWSNHSHADLVAESLEPTQEQLDNAQQIISQLWEIQK